MFSSFLDKILNKKVGKITVFCLFNHKFPTKMSSIVVAMMACFCPPFQATKTKHILTNQTLWIQPLFNDLKRYFFYLRGRPSLPRPPQDLQWVWGHFGPWSWSNFQPPFDGRRYRSCRRFAALEGHKKTFESKCPVFSLFWIQNYSLWIGLSIDIIPFFFGHTNESFNF